jgi:hypothetical protein
LLFLLMNRESRPIQVLLSLLIWSVDYWGNPSQ